MINADGEPQYVHIKQTLNQAQIKLNEGGAVLTALRSITEILVP